MLGFDTQLGYLKACYYCPSLSSVCPPFLLQCCEEHPVEVGGYRPLLVGQFEGGVGGLTPASTCLDSTLWLKRVLSNTLFLLNIPLSFF